MNLKQLKELDKGDVVLQQFHDGREHLIIIQCNDNAIYWTSYLAGGRYRAIVDTYNDITNNYNGWYLIKKGDN